MSVRDVVQAAAGALGGGATYVEDVFSTYLYTGNGSTQTITNGIDLAGEGGMVWFKARNQIANNAVFDTIRGGTKFLKTNSSDAETTRSGLIDSFNSDGFTLGSGDIYGITNYSSSYTYASWTFRKAPKFFDVVTYTGTGSPQNISHNLGSVPGFIIVKRYDGGSEGWNCYHRSLGNNSLIYLNYTDGAFTPNTNWNNTTPTSTVFTVSGSGSVNQSGASFVAYLFAHDAGGFGDDGEQNIISCGSYTGNGSNSITNFVNLGWEAQWVLIKNAGISPSESENWYLVDNMRGSTANTGAVSAYLRPNLNSAEVAPGSAGISVTSQGFYAVGNDGSFNRSGQTYIYIAIRRGPMKTPESGTSVYNAVTLTGNGTARTITGVGFPSDLVISRGVSATTSAAWVDRLRGAKRDLASAATAAELSDPNGLTGLDSMDGFYLGTDGNGYFNYSGFTYVDWCMRRAPGFFDVVAYTGNNIVGRTIPHSLGVAPELMIVRHRNHTIGFGWVVYSSTLGATKILELNQTNAENTSSVFNSTEPTSSVFTVSSSGGVNGTGINYIAYLFASCPGVSKVGSYTGTATTQTIDCGFSSGARFVLIKRIDSTGDWYVWDSARGIVAGNDPYLLLNSTAAEVTSTDYIDPYSAGFTVTSSAPAALNASGGTYIFLAIA